MRTWVFILGEPVGGGSGGVGGRAGTSNAGGAAGGGASGGQKKVTVLSRQLIAANLLKMPLEDAKKLSAREWTALMPTVPWKKFYYYYYIVPLAQLCRALNASTTTRANDRKVTRLVKRYMSGCRKVLGVPFMKEKTIFHRLPHVVKQAADYGGTVNNASTRPFEARHRGPKQTNTNKKEGHNQMVQRENLVQALQVLARGSEFSTVRLSGRGTGATVVDEDKKVVAGPKLVSLIERRYSSLNPYLTSVATAKAQGSSIAVVDTDVVARLEISPGRVDCVKPFLHSRGRRPLQVALAVDPPPNGAPASVRREDSEEEEAVVVPSALDYTRTVALFGAATPALGWYTSGDGECDDPLLAFRSARYFTPGPRRSPKRQAMVTMWGWPLAGQGGQGGNRVPAGSRVSVELPGGR